MRQYLGKQPGVVTVSGDDPKRFAAAMVEYTKEKVGRGTRSGMGGKKVGGHALWDGGGGGLCEGPVHVCVCFTCVWRACTGMFVCHV